MPKYQIPTRRESIRVPNLDYLTANACTTIRKMTGYDPFQLTDEPATLTAVLGWWELKSRDDYRGITVEEVLDWPMGVFDLVEMDDDADDVREAAEDLSAADPNDPVAMINSGGDTEPPTTGR